MSFWKNSGYTYQSFAKLPGESLLMLVSAMTRQDLIDWLSWNEPNGIYQDKQSLKELGNVMFREEGIEIVLRQIEENRVT